MELHDKIKRLGPEEIQDILDALLTRYRELYPDWDVNIVSLEKRKTKRRALLWGRRRYCGRRRRR